MNYYQEIILKDSANIRFFELWSKLYTQLHLALVEHAKATYGENAKQGDLGVSFPDYKCFEKNGKTISFLGNRLRIFANSEVELESLPLAFKLKEYELTDYVRIKSIKPVPAEHRFVTISRARQVKNLDRIARRQAKRHHISFERAKENIIKNYARKNDVTYEQAVRDYANPKLKAYPYINLKSESSGHLFALEIQKTKAVTAQDGLFNTYGLSRTSTVPDW